MLVVSVGVLTEHITHGFSDAVSVDMATNPGNSIREDKEEEKEKGKDRLNRHRQRHTYIYVYAHVHLSMYFSACSEVH